MLALPLSACLPDMNGCVIAGSLEAKLSWLGPSGAGTPDADHRAVLLKEAGAVEAGGLCPEHSTALC